LATTHFKDDIRQLADLKQQILQKDYITLQRIAKMSLLLFLYMC